MSILKKNELYIVKYVVFQYKVIEFSFSENFMFLILKWDAYQFYIILMQIYILSWWKMLILKLVHTNSLSVTSKFFIRIFFLNDWNVTRAILYKQYVIYRLVLVIVTRMVSSISAQSYITYIDHLRKHVSITFK